MFAAGVAPAILGADDKAGSRKPVIGTGDFQYECHHGWGELPEKIKWRNTHGVTVDREGFIYIKHQGSDKAPCDTVVVFDPAGKYVRSFGIEYAGGGHGIDIRYESDTPYLYLSDTLNRQVVKCGSARCGAGQACVHECSCGGAAPQCTPLPDGGACPAGMAPCSTPQGQGCAVTCTNPPPQCRDIPVSCAGVVMSRELDVRCSCPP